ncbi:hypothetical protein SAMN05192558_10143 [Actinokineospora alba]|uniref:Uncharacterized protein n=1 Tax=Actinokineospora alba TaxID=504798 RepID=A0A1H0EPG3_9PSEU|nr:hypothetical protein [Actinokineospora alba]TDP69167.1 hypothetical protein C8E96_4740 [Actinokineospora alba]SDI22889.1 hypothetical protein SAMN05421871_103826 [Actinokineospora alba]SDN84250.1 hypothetical protein SAMN05192558_10143 [Actinokineospora alba]
MDSFALFLVLGIVLVAVDGQIIYRAGSRYLENSYTDDSSAGSMARLVSVLFHLAVLGVLALLSTIDFSADSPTESVVIRLGVLLLVLAIGHAIAIKVLTRMRDRLDAEGMSARRFEHTDPAEPTDQVASSEAEIMVPPHDDRTAPTVRGPRRVDPSPPR